MPSEDMSKYVTSLGSPKQIPFNQPLIAKTFKSEHYNQ